MRQLLTVNQSIFLGLQWIFHASPATTSPLKTSFWVWQPENQQINQSLTSQKLTISIDMHSIFHSCFHCIILIAFAALVPTIVHSATLATDIQVLRLLKRSIDPNTIPRSSFLDSWDFKLDPCESSGGQFLGILCSIPSDNSTSRITAIYLDSSGYDGFLTPSIGNLTELTTLDLSRNNFRGPIPDTVTGLRKLTTLSLPGNFFTGNIPVGITRLKKLQTLDLSHNSLSGIIPAQLSGLRSLTALRLSHNAFSGKIPSLTGAWQLHTLDLDSNQLYGNLPKFPTSLRTLSLSHNLLSGHLSSLRNLVNLKSLDLSSNRFTGAISHEVLTLPQVVSIDVSVNRLTAIEMTTLSGDTHLQELDVQGNLLRGHLPINLVSLRNLTSINLARNQLSGHIPKVYGAKLGSSWRSLFLDHNFLWGNLPPEFSSSITRIRGSLAKNCLSCPETIRLCHGGQRPASECVGQNDKEWEILYIQKQILNNFRVYLQTVVGQFISGKYY